jgi:hypothetical protein
MEHSARRFLGWACGRHDAGIPPTLTRLFAALCLLTGLSSAAHADPLVYTLSGNFSGTLGGSSFTDDFGTFTETAASSNVTSIATPLFQS